MRRRTPWLLLALTAALLLAASIARGNDPTELGRPAAESAFAERVEEGLRSWFGPTLLPERLTLELLTGPDLCAVIGRTGLYWHTSGGVPPYTVTVDGQQVDGGAGSVPVRCRSPETSLPACDPLRSSHRTVLATVTDSRGVSAKAELQVALGEPPSPAEPGAVRQDASGGVGLRLSWRDPAPVPPVCTYELQYQATAWDATSWPDSWTAISEAIEAGATTYLHRNLDPNRRYRYQLRAKNNIGASYWSPAFPEAGARPGALALAAQTAASGSVALSWSAGPADATRWEYRWRQAGGSWGAWTTIAGSNTSTTEHTVGGLTEDARYQFQLRAITADGTSPTSAIASAIAGLMPTVPSERESLRYDDLDSTGGATRPGSYAFLKDADDLTSGAATFAEVSGAEALLLNASGYARRYYGAVLASVRVGDRFTWHPYSRCWYYYRVTEVLSVPTTPTRRLFRIVLEAEDPCGVAAARAGNAKSYFDESRDNSAWFSWGDPPNALYVGADGIRIMPGRYAAEGGYTYRLIEQGPIVIDVPASMRLRFGRASLASTGIGYAMYVDDVTGSHIILDPSTGQDAAYHIETPEGETEPPAEVVARFEALLASIREVPLPPTASDE